MAGEKVPVPRLLARTHAIIASSGIRVAGVEASSPGSAAGIRTGDIIVSYDDQATAGVDELHRLLDEDRIGVPAQLTVLRSTELRRLVVVPREAPLVTPR